MEWKFISEMFYGNDLQFIWYIYIHALDCDFLLTAMDTVGAEGFCEGGGGGVMGGRGRLEVGHLRAYISSL